MAVVKNFSVCTVCICPIFGTLGMNGVIHYMSLFMPYANNKAAYQPAHSHSLISAFVVRYLDSMIPQVYISEISSLHLASVAAQAGLCLTWSQTPKTGLLVTGLNLFVTFYAGQHTPLLSPVDFHWFLQFCYITLKFLFLSWSFSYRVWIRHSQCAHFVEEIVDS